MGILDVSALRSLLVCEARDKTGCGLKSLATIQLLTPRHLNVLLGQRIGCPMPANLAHRKIICLAFNGEEGDEILIERVQPDAVPAKRVDLARSVDDADAASEEFASDAYDFLPVIKRDVISGSDMTSNEN